MTKTIQNLILIAWSVWAAFWVVGGLGLLIWDQLTIRGIHGPGGWFLLAMASFSLGVSAIVAALLSNRPDLR